MLTGVIIAAALIVVHELGHIAANRQLGGRFRGAVFRGVAVGVRLELPRGLRAIAVTSLAGPATEGLLALLLLATAAAHGLPMSVVPWTIGIVCLDWAVNLLPVGHTDGARILRAWRAHRERRALAS
jgi:Zn-dependent protease